MKSQHFTSFLLLLNSLFFLASCVGDDKFKIPEISITEPKIEGEIIDINAVLGNYNQVGEIVTFNATNTVMVGYVISNDEGGNFYKKLILQNKPENPTAGIAIQLDKTPLFTKYEFGRKIYVKLDGLSVGLLNGTIQLGRLEGNNIVRIPASEINNYIIKSTELATIIPKPVTLCNLSNDLENLFIGLNEVQFNKNEVLGNLPKTFAAEQEDQFNGERRIESCLEEGTGGSILLSTSTFSDFKSVLLPPNKGTLDGLLSRDFFDEYYVMLINSPKDINFTNTQRCDAETLDCGTIETVGSTNLFSDDFQSQTNNELIMGNGWTNYIQSGTKGWEAYTSGGSNPSQGRSARIAATNSQGDCSIAWLITPAIDLTENQGVSFHFETSNSFADGSELDVLFSTNWDGSPSDIRNANWGRLSAAYVVQDTDLFSNWFSSGNVNLSCKEGTLYIAFRYRGNNQPDLDGTFELDNISIDKFQ